MVTGPNGVIGEPAQSVVMGDYRNVSGPVLTPSLLLMADLVSVLEKNLLGVMLNCVQVNM